MVTPIQHRIKTLEDKMYKVMNIMDNLLEQQEQEKKKLKDLKHEVYVHVGSDKDTAQEF